MPINQSVPTKSLSSLAAVKDEASSLPDRAGDPFTVLLVDDDPFWTDLIEVYLAEFGVHVLTAGTVADAMRVLDARPVHVVLADWVMPAATGLDLCRWARGRRFARPLHFVMLTANTDRQSMAEAFLAGVDDFLTKPLHAVELLARLRAWARFVRLQQDLADRHADAAALNDRLAAANADLAVANARLSELATTDELTGLPNRREAIRRLAEQWAVCRRYDKPLACALVDVDRFKQINDTYGHAAGDEVLRHVAAVLREGVRAADGVFRLGGDEFLLLFPEQSAADAAAGVDRLRRAAAARTVRAAGDVLSFTLSVGLAERSAGSTADDLLKAADEALYAVKRSGRNAVHVAAAPTSPPPGLLAAVASAA